MRKSKRLTKITGKLTRLLMAFAAAFILFGTAAPALADPAPLQQAQTSAASGGSCNGVTNASAPAPTCADCHPSSGTAPATCGCYPEYSYGTALTPEQLSSCLACQNNKTAQDTANCLSNNVIVRRLNDIVNILSGLVGIVVVGVIIAGGIQYSMAGKPEAAAAARKRIINGLIALFAFFFIWAFLQWLIPGGV